jgi:hypothetical protein
MSVGSTLRSCSNANCNASVMPQSYLMATRYRIPSCSYVPSGMGARIATGCGLQFESRRGPELVPFSMSSRLVLEPPSSPLPSGYRRLFRPGRESVHSLPSDAEVKKTWIYTPPPQYVFMAKCFVKHEEDLTMLWHRRCIIVSDVMNITSSVDFFFILGLE